MLKDFISLFTNFRGGYCPFPIKKLTKEIHGNSTNKLLTFVDLLCKINLILSPKLTAFKLNLNWFK